MDWTMVNNADGPRKRVQTLAYLLQCRYEADAQEAGRRLWAECQTNALCKQTMDELRAELVSETGDVSVGTVIKASDSRRYMQAVLDSFNRSAGAPKTD